MKTRIISGAVSIFVIAMLLFLGPAQALILGLSVSDSSPFLGDIISFSTSADIEPGDELDADDYFILELIGPEGFECRFSLKGEELSSCPGVNVTLISSPSFGYGYGYGNFTSGKFEYKIDLDTSVLKPWVYHTKIIAVIDQDENEKIGPDIVITKRSALLQGCSVRSQGGEFFVLGQNLTDGTKMNFNIPIRNSANSGQGNLISQTGKGRFSYKFDFIKVLDVENESATLLTSGSYRNGPGMRVDAEAILFLDKENELVGVYSDDFSLVNSKVKFLRRC